MEKSNSNQFAKVLTNLGAGACPSPSRILQAQHAVVICSTVVVHNK